MKKLLIMALVSGAFICADAADVYVDASDRAAMNEMQLAAGSSDSIVFHVSANGTPFAADSYTPVLLVSKTAVFRTEETLTAIGTASGSTATFSASDIKVSISKNGWFYQLVFRAGLAGSYTYSYPVNGKLVVSDTPLSVTGSSSAIAGFGGHKAVQTSIAVTNGATLTATSGTYILNGIGSPNDTTNTVTLANATGGQALRIIVNPASSNLVLIADADNTSLSGDWIGDNNDTIDLIGIGTNWVQTGESNN